MTGIAGKAMLFSLGVFLGVIFFGVSVSLTHYNRLVDPEHPLKLLEWQTENGHPGIQLLGETLHLRVNRELPGQMREKAGAMIRPVIDEASGWSAAVQTEFRESGWPERINSTAREAGHCIIVTVGRFSSRPGNDGPAGDRD